MKQKEQQQEVMVITENQCFTKDEANRYLRYTVSDTNFEILEDFICDPELAECIQAYSEQNGVIQFLVGDEWISVKMKCADNLKPL